MFGRKKDEQTIESTTDEARTEPERTGAKNRPTPSRREAEAARRRPLVPADRKAAAARSREEERAQRAKVRAGMMAGEEWALPPRDRGPQRAFIRDSVDARWNLSEFLLPIMVVGLAISLLQNRSMMLVGYLLVYGAIALAVVDGFFMWFSVKKRVRKRFGENPQKGSLWYAVSRAMQMRMGRMPRPRVRRGEYPA